jgi:hypothetical protein
LRPIYVLAVAAAIAAMGSVLPAAGVAVPLSKRDARLEAAVRIAPAPDTKPGAFGRIVAQVSPATDKCSIQVGSPDGLVSGSALRPRRAVAGRIVWRWKLSSRATPGLWPVFVRCTRAGVGRGGMLVLPTVPAPRLEVVASGFSATPSGGGFVQTYAYGAIIRNLSRTADALSVTVDETGLNSSGTESGVHFDSPDIIPAGATLYLGGTLYASSTTSIRFDVKAEPVA